MKLDIDKKDIDVNVEGDIVNIKIKDSKLYQKNRPEGITKDILAKVNEYNTDYSKAVIDLITDESIKVFKKNEGVKTAIGKASYMPGGSISAAVHKSKKFKHPTTGEDIFKPQVQATIRTTSAKANKEWLRSLSDKIMKSV